MIKKQKPLILAWDLETSHNICATFSLYQDGIPFQAILKERSIICASYKEIGAGQVKAISVLGDMERFKKDPQDDYYVVSELYKILSKADGLVAHYGDKFDLKFFNTRALYHGLDPLPPITTIDTYKIAKKRFGFNSNKLDYIAKYLGLGRKIPMNIDIWLNILKGSIKAVRQMVDYNKQDVLVLEQVFLKLRPHVPSSINFNLFGNTDSTVCPACGGYHIQKRGFTKTRSSLFQRYQCVTCRHFFQGGKSLTTVTTR